MKKPILNTIFFLALMAGFTSCSGDDDLNPVVVTDDDGVDPTDDDDTGGTDDNILQGTVLEGNITEDLLVETGEYNLRGAVTVKNGATLTIQQGSTFTVSAEDQEAGVNLIFVEQGGRIVAEGTATQPIVFTSENKNAEGGDGDWGGIGIHGRATMNAPGGNSLSEAGQLPYGGTDDADDSGSLKYVRVEYAGQASSDGQFEFNSFSFFAVGSGTTLENLEAFEGADDGFEFYGGTVNAKNLSAVGMEDDSVDWDEGFRGSIDNLVIYQYDGIGDFAFELASRSGENNATPRSKATVSNVTFRGHNRAGKSAFDLKQGTGGIFDNMIGYNYETMIFVNDQLQEVDNGDLEFTDIHFYDYTNLLVNNIEGSEVGDSEVVESLISMNEEATGADLSAFEGWSNFDEMGGFEKE